VILFISGFMVGCLFITIVIGLLRSGKEADIKTERLLMKQELKNILNILD
jgi:hypothetical protein